MPSSSHNNIFMINSPQPGMSMPKGVDDNFYTGFGTLFKHCKEIHLPGAGRFIRLGTLAEYRTNENSAIRDEEEGMFKVTLDFPNSTAMPVDILKRLTLNTANFGPGTHLDNLRIASFYFDKTCGCIQSREDVEVSNKTENQVTFSGRIDLLAEGADAFVLCLSTSADSDSVIEDTEYDSVWTLKSACLEQFTKTMADYLIDIPAQEVVSNQTLGPLNAPGFSTPEFDADTKFCFSTEVVEVAYQSRIVAVPPNVTEEIIAKVYHCINNSASIKPVEFIQEKEVRIIFRLNAINTKTGQRFLSPRYLKPQLVPFEPFLDFVEVHS